MLLVIPMLGTTIRAKEIDVALRNRFLAAVPQTVKKLRELSFEAKCIARQDSQQVSDSLRPGAQKDNPDARKAATLEVTCAMRGPFGSVTGIDRQGMEFVRAKNGEYAFALKRSPLSKSKTYSLSLLERLGVNPEIDQKMEAAAADYASSVLRTWYFSTETVVQIIESPTFRMKKIATIQSNEAELVRIDFDRLLPDPQKRSYSYSDAFMICAPDHYWALTEYGGTSFDGELTFRTTITSRDLIDGFPIPETIVHVISNLKDSKSFKSVITTEVTRRDVPKEEFYLSHYGLPEPNFRRGWFGTWAWYLVAGVACFCAALIFRRHKQAQRVA